MTVARSRPHGRTRLSEVAAGGLGSSVGGVTLLPLPRAMDERGAVTYGEFPGELPFVPRRVFLVSDVPAGKRRGEHAHREIEQLLICVHGEVTVTVDDGIASRELVLDRTDIGLHLGPMIWTTLHEFSEGAVLLALASDRYDLDEYIHDHDEFLAAVRRG